MVDRQIGQDYSKLVEKKRKEDGWPPVCIVDQSYRSAGAPEIEHN
jgi:hypothetical protein